MNTVIKAGQEQLVECSGPKLKPKWNLHQEFISKLCLSIRGSHSARLRVNSATEESQILGQQNLLSQYYSLIIASVVGALYPRTLDPSWS